MNSYHFDSAEKKFMFAETILNEINDKELNKLMSRELQKIRLIPLDMFAAKEAISNIIMAEVSRKNLNFQRNVTDLMSLNLNQVSIRNKFRFDNYYRRFIGSRSRGFDFEGLIAGLLDAEISESKTSPYDIVTNNMEKLSLKTLNNFSESPVLKSLKTNYREYLNSFIGNEEYSNELESIIASDNPLKFLIDSGKEVFLNVAQDILQNALKEIDGMLVGIPMSEHVIKMLYYTKEKLIELALTPGMVTAPKTKGSMQIRFSTRILKSASISGEIIFPNLTKKEYEDFLVGDETTSKTIQLLNNFGNKYGVNGLGRQLPQDVVMDLAKSDSFITDINFILGSK